MGLEPTESGHKAYLRYLTEVISQKPPPLYDMFVEKLTRPVPFRTADAVKFTGKSQNYWRSHKCDNKLSDIVISQDMDLQHM